MIAFLVGVVAVLGSLALAGTAALCASRVRRLHRLHIRLDAARAGLDLALARRAAAAAAAGVAVPAGVADPVAVAGPAGPGVADSGVAGPTGVAAPVGAADPGVADPDGAADPAGREMAANALARRLARLDRSALAPPVRAALAEAEELLVLARRVHNDAVRDTLGLRSRRLVRWLRLAGSAPMPAYFETAEPHPAGATSAPVPGATGAAVTSGTPERHAS